MTTPLTLADAQAMAASLLEARRARHADFRMEADGGDPTGGDPTGGTPDPTGGDPEGGKPEETPDEKAARLEAELAESKRHSRTWEDRAKANKDAAKKLADIEAANATPDQKLTLAEQRAAAAETELARYRVAHETALPAALLSLLNGDEDQMRDQAKALLAFKGETATPPKRQPPAPDPTQGGGQGDGSKPSAADEGKAEAQRRAALRKKP